MNGDTASRVRHVLDLICNARMAVDFARDGRDTPHLEEARHYLDRVSCELHTLLSPPGAPWGAGYGPHRS